jgi:hypothetical protein
MIRAICVVGIALSVCAGNDALPEVTVGVVGESAGVEA